MPATLNNAVDAASAELACRTQPPRQDIGKLIMWGLLFAILASSWNGADMRPMELMRDGDNMFSYAASFFPPDFHLWRNYLQELLVTLQMAVWGTALAAVCAMPFGLLCSANIAPWWIRQPVRRLMDAARAINEIVFAMLFVAAVGLGPFAGVLALFAHTTGVLARLYSEEVEAIDKQSLEGMRATWANAPERIALIVPQVMPRWICCVLSCFQSNVRSATVVGLVGAGGIGVTLWEIIRSFEYQKTAAVLIMVVITVIVVEMVSSRLRKKFL